MNTLTIGSYKTPNSRAYFLDTTDLERPFGPAFAEMDKALDMRRKLNESIPCWQVYYIPGAMLR